LSRQRHEAMAGPFEQCIHYSMGGMTTAGERQAIMSV